MKKHASAIVLVIIAAALGVWLWMDRNAVTQGERKLRENNVFAAWRKEELSKVAIHRFAPAADAGRPTSDDVDADEEIALERDAKKDTVWRMTAPRESRADQAAAERLMTTLEFARAVRKVEDNADLGFDKPRAIGAITMGGLVLKFTLGGPSPRPEGSSYFRVEGEAPIVVSREVTNTLLASADVYRDRSVVPYLSLELQTFQAKPAKSGGFTLERLDDHSFTIANLGVLARREAVESIWGALAEMRAEAFPKEVDADRLTASPVLTLIMIPKDASKPRAELVVGEACPGHPDDVVVVRRAPTRAVACAPKGVLEAFAAPPQVFVERRLFSISADEIEEVTLEWLNDADAAGAPRTIEIARKGSGWHERAPADKDLSEGEADAASDLVTRMATSQADAATPLGNEKIEPIVARAKIRFAAGERTRTVDIGRIREDGTALARREHDGARLFLAREIARRFVPRATSLKPRELLGETRRVTRVLLRCGAPQELVDEGEGLRLVEPKGYETDASITQLVDLLARRKIEAWVADKPSVDMGLEKEDGCRVVLSFEDEKDPKTIRFGEVGPDGLYGKVDGSPHVFAASQLLKDLASRWYPSRAALRTPEDDIVEVKVEKGAEHKSPADVLRAGAAALIADRVETVGRAKDLGGPDALVVSVTAKDAKASKRITCGPPKGSRRLCAVTGVDAVFAVREPSLAPFVGTAAGPDGGALARDAGPR